MYATAVLLVSIMRDDTNRYLAQPLLNLGGQLIRALRFGRRLRPRRRHDAGQGMLVLCRELLVVLELQVVLSDHFLSGVLQRARWVLYIRIPMCFANDYIMLHSRAPNPDSGVPPLALK